MASFDIVNEIDAQEVDNAVNNTLKEVSTRYDFRGLHTEVEYHNRTKPITIAASGRRKILVVKEMLIKHIVKRGMKPKVLEFGKEEGTTQGHVKVDVSIKEGIDRGTTRKIVKEVKSLKLKVQPAIQDGQVRVTGKKIDDLQETIRHLKSKSFEVPLQFVNMK